MGIVGWGLVIVGAGVVGVVIDRVNHGRRWWDGADLTQRPRRDD